MTNAIENLKSAMQRAMAGRPKAGGFPYLAETLRRAGVIRNLWFLPACQSLYITDKGPVAVAGTSLIADMAGIPSFNREALIAALRTDQAGDSTFPEFLMASWKSGVVKFEVDFSARTCTYYGVGDGNYVESYPVVEI